MFRIKNVTRLTRQKNVELGRKELIDRILLRHFQRMIKHDQDSRAECLRLRQIEVERRARVLSPSK